MKNSLLKITMKEMIVLFINHITIRSNWHTYPIINWVANPWIWAITFHWILKYLWCILRVCFCNYLYWTLALWITICDIQKDAYLPGRSKQWLIVINLTNINQEQYNYYRRSSISHAHIASTITYPHFNPINTLSIFHSITNRNIKISISLLHKHLQKFQH